jgi:dephospho-CoA kinase
MIIGLTGPIASGKNEVADALKRLGAYIVDVDKVAHGLYVPQSALWQELVKNFGSKILMRGGKINRRKLGEIVFSDKENIEIINSIVHPRLKMAVCRLIEKVKVDPKWKIIVVNAAILKEIGLIDVVDEVWVVAAPVKVREKRLLKQGLSRMDAGRRIRSQAAQKEYFKIADKVIKNEGSLSALKKKVNQIIRDFLSIEI